MLEGDLLDSIGFSYASYMNGVKTDGFAIPDWRSLGPEFANSAFSGILANRLQTSTDASGLQTMDDVIQRDGGTALTDELRRMTHKFLRNDATDMALPACQMVTFFGRKLLFDQDTSTDMKKSDLLDGILAAQKKSISETRYNLYPKGTSLETVRLAMEQALARVGVDVALDMPLETLDMAAKTVNFSDAQTGFGKIFMGGDARDSEQRLFGTDKLAQATMPLPEIFHCFVVPEREVDEAYYLIDYDTDHLATRMTNFCKYMDARDVDGNGVVCIEQPVDMGSDDWTDPSRNQNRVFQEARETGNIRCDSYLAAQSFAIPVIYKVPKAGFLDIWAGTQDRVAQTFGNDVLLPDATTLTRKQTLDDLRQMGILH